MRSIIILLTILAISVSSVFPQEDELTLDDLNRMISRDPGNASLYEKRAGFYYELGNHVEELRDMQQAVSIEPSAVNYKYLGEAQFNLGLAQHNPKMFLDAIDSYSCSIRLDPQSMCYYLRGQIYLLGKDFEKALADYTRAIELDPQVPGYYVDRGAVYHATGKYQEALSDFSKAKDLDPQDAYYYYLTGAAYSLLGNHREAIDDFNRAIAMQPDDLRPFFSRAYAYFETGRYQEAINDMTKIIGISPDANIYKGRARAFQALAEQTKNKKEKAEYLKKSEADFAMVEKLGGVKW